LACSSVRGFAHVCAVEGRLADDDRPRTIRIEGLPGTVAAAASGQSTPGKMSHPVRSSPRGADQQRKHSERGLRAAVRTVAGAVLRTSAGTSARATAGAVAATSATHLLQMC
jgi:hypothetical protein